MTIHDEYMYYQDKYEKIYGDKCVVLMQVGSFHECYSVDLKKHDLSKIAELLELTLTRKSKKEPPSERNPFLVGFPSVAFDKYIRRLVNGGYTVPVFDQVTPPPDPKRELVNIYSPGTYIEEGMKPESQNTGCIYIEDEIQKDKSFLICIGVSITDVSTGKTITHETISTKMDKNIACDETVRLINSYSPKEIVVFRKKQERNVDTSSLLSEKELLGYLELTDKNCKYYEKIDKKWFKPAFRETFLKKIYETSGIYDTVIEFIDLEKRPYALMSLVLLMDFILSHNGNLLEKVCRPEIFQGDNYLILGNNAVGQLNIVRSDLSDDTATKFKSLYDTINHTVTAVGRRFLRERLCNPLTDVKIISESYDRIEAIRERSIDNLTSYLAGIVDIERLGRKMCTKSIHPHEFAEFIKSYKKIYECLVYLNADKSFKNLVDDKICCKVKEFIDKSDNMFDYERLEMYRINDIENSVFQKGQFNEVDKLQICIDTNIEYMNKVCSVLSTYIRDDRQKNIKQENQIKIRLEHNKNEGYHLKTTALRARYMKKELSKLALIQLNDQETINPTSISYKDMKGSTKISFDRFEHISTETMGLSESVSTVIVEQYLKIIDQLCTSYIDTFRTVSDIVAIVDFSLSAAKTANMYNYCRPIASNDRNKGFIQIEQLRHPIIERLTEAEYIPHNIELGTKKKGSLDGMLIFGLNSSGKSSLMKAVGLAVVMAQCGMFVSAKSFKFAPFNSLFARITGNDNIFKGLSSFALEMVELGAILKRVSPKTLVIGDEVCRGTESVSGNAIVASAIVHLAKSGTSFMFATHLHKIPEISEVKTLPNVRPFHLTVETDQKSGKLIFDRKLRAGAGDNIYGIKIAKHIVDHNEFIALAEKIRMDLTDEPTPTVTTEKTSRYNSKVVMDRCTICNKMTKSSHEIPLDTHHINHQKDCEKGFVKNKPHLKMNAKANLVVLCRLCHTKHHKGELKIHGYKKTSSGIELDFESVLLKK